MVEQTSVERDLVVIHSQLNDTTFEKVWAEGDTLSMGQAIKIALVDKQ